MSSLLRFSLIAWFFIDYLSRIPFDYIMDPESSQEKTPKGGETPNGIFGFVINNQVIDKYELSTAFVNI